MPDPDELLKAAFKLSLYEAKVYRTLLKGAMTPKEAAHASKVPPSRVYDTLSSLGDKGFVEEVGDRFQALPPQQSLGGRVAQFEASFRKEQEEREKAKQVLLQTLEPLYQRKEAPYQDIHLLRGIYPIVNRFQEIFAHAHDIVLGVRKAVTAKDLFRPSLSQASGKKIRILLSKDVKLAAEDLGSASAAGAELRRCGILLFDVMVADDQDVLIGVPDPLSEDVYHSIAIWVRNPSFATSIRESLEELWRTGEEYSPSPASSGLIPETRPRLGSGDR